MIKNRGKTPIKSYACRYSNYPCFCLCLGFLQIILTTPLRRTILQLEHIFLTLARTFILILLTKNQPQRTQRTKFISVFSLFTLKNLFNMDSYLLYLNIIFFSFIPDNRHKKYISLKLKPTPQSTENNAKNKNSLGVLCGFLLYFSVSS